MAHPSASCISVPGPGPPPWPTPAPAPFHPTPSASSCSWQPLHAALSWQVVEERFGPAALPVPFLEDAGAYELLSVLVRTGRRAPSWLRRARPLVPVGALERLVQQGAEPGELALCTREYGARARGEARYEETRLVEGAPCHIRLQLAGLHKRTAFLSLRPGQVALRPDLPWLRAQHSLYLIHEAFCSAGLALAVTRGQAQRTLRLTGPCPVAFRCLKFALGPRGELGPQKPLGRALPARANWVKLASLAPPYPAQSQSQSQSQSGPLHGATRTGTGARGLRAMRGWGL
ncbi:uncharacterized protein C11orf42 homolog [Carettochelys insculpta]|uniref:uncharacterized protein C11orf42 homolog n=1 Tax=Carettochelys insculpta TaxID=44489 RepID=UPI003EBEBE05